MHIIYVYIERERERVCISQRGRDWSVGKKPPYALAFVVDAPHTTAETLDHRSLKKERDSRQKKENKFPRVFKLAEEHHGGDENDVSLDRVCQNAASDVCPPPH